MGKKHPEDLRLVAVAMARMVGPDQAADDLELDVRTVKSWLHDTPKVAEMDDPMEAAYAAAERVALYRNLRALGKGTIRDPIRLNALGGTARDKLFRFLARREAKDKQAEQQPEEEPNPIGEAIRAVEPVRRDLARYSVLAVGMGAKAPADWSSVEGFLAWVGTLHDLSDADAAAQLEQVQAEYHALLDARYEREAAERDKALAAVLPQSEPEPAPQAAEKPAEALQPAKRPAPRPDVYVLPIGDHIDDHPSWRRTDW